MKIKMMETVGPYWKNRTFRVLEPGEEIEDGTVGPRRAATWIKDGIAVDADQVDAEPEPEEPEVEEDDADGEEE